MSGNEGTWPAQADQGTQTIVFEAFSIETGELATANEWKPAEKRQLMAYVMRWRRGGTKWVRLTFPDGTTKDYGRPS